MPTPKYDISNTVLFWVRGTQKFSEVRYPAPSS